MRAKRELLYAVQRALLAAIDRKRDEIDEAIDRGALACVPELMSDLRRLLAALDSLRQGQSFEEHALSIRLSRALRKC